MLWPEIDDPYERFRAAAGAGFSRVERLFVHDLDAARVGDLLGELGLELVLFDPYPGDWEAGERGLLAVPGRELQMRETVLEAIETAQVLGVARLNVLSGMLPDGVDRKDAKEVAVANLCSVADAAHDAGITLLVEMINEVDWPGYAVPTLADALDVVQGADHDAVRLQFDAYHVARAGNDVLIEIGRSIELVRHVQIADAPGRHQPGTGSLPVDPFLTRLDELGYEGAVGLEYIPEGTTDEALAWLPETARA